MAETEKAYYKNRFEHKYVLRIETYYKIMRELDALFKKDALGDNNGKYEVISLYYDSPQLHSFWEKIDGEEKRSKLRMRTYVHKGKRNPKVFVEIKKKNNMNVMKERIELKEKDARSLLEDRQSDEKFINKVPKSKIKALGEIIYLKKRFRLQPTILISYTRQAFVSKDNLNVRITFDSNIRYRDRDFSLETKETDNHVLPPGLLIMEIKYSDYLPLWVVHLIQKYNCELKTFSKYCSGMENLFQEKPILGEMNGMVY